MLAKKAIKPATTKWAATIVFSDKKNVSLRFCINYWKLNDVTIHNSYHLARMDECIDVFGEATFSSTLSAKSVYWKIKIDERDR